MEQLRDRVVVVTGAASGMGRSMAHAFGREGCRVVAADVEEPALAVLAEGLASVGVLCLPVLTDVADASSVDRLADAAMDAYGAVHILCNNAGVSVTASVLDLTLADWEWVLGVDLWGHIHGLRSFLPILLDQDEAHVVATASVTGLHAFPMRAAYNAAKYAVVGLVESLQLELADTAPQVGLTLLCPGAVRTRMVDSARNRPAHRGAATMPAGSDVEEEVARAHAIVDVGLDPAAVADLVVDAVRRRQFYLLTEPSLFAPAIEERTRAILAGTPPEPVPTEAMFRPRQPTS